MDHINLKPTTTTDTRILDLSKGQPTLFSMLKLSQNTSTSQMKPTSAPDDQKRTNTYYMFKNQHFFKPKNRCSSVNVCWAHKLSEPHCFRHLKTSFQNNKRDIKKVRERESQREIFVWKENRT